MKNDITLDGLIKPVIVFFKRFHTILFFLVVSAGLFIAILMLLSVINASSDKSATADNAVSGSFDEDTIRRLENGRNKNISPEGRPSPFVE